jgi:hypothetical protein
MLLRLCIQIHRLMSLQLMFLCRGHDAIACLSSRDLSSYEYISVTKLGFVPISLKPIDNRINIIM